MINDEVVQFEGKIVEFMKKGMLNEEKTDLVKRKCRTTIIKNDLNELKNKVEQQENNINQIQLLNSINSSSTIPEVNELILKFNVIII